MDDDGSCAELMDCADGKKHRLHVEGDNGFLWPSIWHLYADKDGRVWPIRCPGGLGGEERDRMMVDIPPGTIGLLMASRRKIETSEPKTAKEW